MLPEAFCSVYLHKVTETEERIPRARWPGALRVDAVI